MTLIRAYKELQMALFELQSKDNDVFCLKSNIKLAINNIIHAQQELEDVK